MSGGVARRLRAWWERVVEQERQADIGSDDDLMAIADAVQDAPRPEFVERLRLVVVDEARKGGYVRGIGGAVDPGGWEL